MKVLFVVSSNSKSFKLSPFIEAQGDALKRKGIDLQYFSISGKGILGYIKSSIRLKSFLKNNFFDIIHAHYTLCGWVTILTISGLPTILSLMGDDAYGTYYKHNKVRLRSRYLTIMTILIQPFIKGLISKSKNIDDYVYKRNISNIIPNGVNFQNFPIFDKDFRDELGLDRSKKYILFLGDTIDKNKNFKLVLDSFDFINNNDIELLTPYPASQESVVKYLWSIDVFVLSSFKEGSANVIKEAMACNCPIVATDAGDARWVLGDTKGCYIAEFDPKDFSNKIINALDFAVKYKRTMGRKRLIELELDSESVAQKIINVYKRSLI